VETSEVDSGFGNQSNQPGDKIQRFNFFIRLSGSAGRRSHRAQLIPEVVEWHRGPLGERSGYPLEDPRAKVHIGDVAELLKSRRCCYDVIALDVDNGPEGLSQSVNDWLYSMQGILAAQQALTPGGVLAYWSARSDQAFHDRLRRCGFLVEEVTVFAHGTKGVRHTIWLAGVD